MIDNNLNLKTIIFSANDGCIPEPAKGWWHPLHFPPEKPEGSFDRLLIEIFRQYITIYAPPEVKPENIGAS